MKSVVCNTLCGLQVVKRFSLKRKAEVFKAPRCKAKAQALAKRLLGADPILEVYRSTEKKKKIDHTKIVKLLQQGKDKSEATPWYWRDSSWQQLWMAIDGFTVEKRMQEERTRARMVFVQGNEELPVYTRDLPTSPFACEKHGYMAITMAGYGLVAAVAMFTSTRLSKTRRTPIRTRFRFWYDMLVQLGIGDQATEDMLRAKVWLVCFYLAFILIPASGCVLCLFTQAYSQQHLACLLYALIPSIR